MKKLSDSEREKLRKQLSEYHMQRLEETARNIDQANEARSSFRMEKVLIKKGVLGGIAMMAIAVIWSFIAWNFGYIFYYTPVLFFIGLYAFIKGIVTSNFGSRKRGLDASEEGRNVGTRNIIVLMILGTVATIAILRFVIPRFVTAPSRQGSAELITVQPTGLYVDLRKLALGIQPSDIGIAVEPNSKKPYGILMDMSLPSGGVATLTSYANGDASMYFSTGGGILGGIGHASTRNAAKRFVAVAQSYIQKMEVATSYPLPAIGQVKFYVLTPQGILTTEASEADLEARISELSTLYGMGHGVITEMRLWATSMEGQSSAK